MSEISTLIEGKYDVIAKIREGGMGTIYKVRHRLLEEIRVVKVMRQSVVGDVELKRRFLEEAKTATRLKHPNIATIYDFALGDDGTAYLVMEFIDGVTLGEILKSQGSVGLALGLEIAHQTLLALGYLHRKNVVHRDIAPDNLMLTYDEEGDSRIKLIDLGIAKVLDRRGEMTSTGVFLGKVRYASPEQYGSLVPGEIIDGRSDLYSLGLVLYELLTGHRPFVGDTPIELLRAHVFQEPTSFSITDPEGLVPEGVRAVVFKAMQKRREDRFISAQDFDREILSLKGQFSRPFDIDPAQAIISLVRGSPVEGTDFVTPSAQDRLDRHFRAQPTPVQPSNPRGTAFPDTVVDPEAKEALLLGEIRERESKGDLHGLESVAQASRETSRTGQAAREAVRRLRERADFENAKRQAEEADWRECEVRASETAWQQYVDRHPDSPRREEAVRRVSESKAFREAGEAATSRAWTAFLAKWPQGSHREEAEKRARESREKEDASLAEATRTGTAEAFRAFLREHPDSYLVPAAGRYLEEQIAFDSARSSDTVRAWQEFQSRWPSGRLSGSAAAGLKAARRREADALKAAIEEGTPGALRQYLAQYPEADDRSRVAAELRESLAFEAAGAEGIAGWERFLKEYPDGRHNAEARTALRKLYEKRSEEIEALLQTIRQHEEAGRQGDLELLEKKYPAENHPVGSAARAALGRVREAAQRRKAAEQAAREALRIKTEAEEREKEAAKHRELEGLRQREAEERERAVVQQLELKAQREREAAQLREREAAKQLALEAKREREAAKQREREAEQRERTAAKPRELEARQQREAEKLELGVQAIPGAEARRGRRYAALAATVLIAAAGAWFLTHRTNKSNAASEVPIPADGGQSTAGQPTEPASASLAVAPARTGSLVVDALPWAEVVRLEDSSGKNWLSGKQAYTPMVIALPPGKYSVVMKNADFPDRTLTVPAEVGDGASTSCVGNFQPTDAAAYFEMEGWRR